MLTFQRGDIIALLVPEARNGWLYGKLEGTPRQGWFPCSYIRPLGEQQRPPASPQRFPLRNSQSADDLLSHGDIAIPTADYSRERDRTPLAAPPPAPAPPTANPPPHSTGGQHSSVRSLGSALDTTSNKVSVRSPLP
uniref:SH3 domain-containing protein n=1 Tax=Callorhinchus milii TaxID=7868 RepID=A0A4W3GJG0_CALMI